MQKLRCALLFLSMIALTSPAWSDDKADAAELAKLEGTYTFVTGEKDGEPPPPQVIEQFKKIQVVIKGNSFKFVIEGKPDRDNEIKLDATKSPKQIDLSGTSNDGKKKVSVSGIYSIEGKTLKLCIDENGKSRPTGFDTKGKGKSIVTMVFERK